MYPTEEGGLGVGGDGMRQKETRVGVCCIRRSRGEELGLKPSSDHHSLAQGGDVKLK